MSFFLLCSVLFSLGFACTVMVSRGSLFISLCLIIQVYLILVLVVPNDLSRSRRCCLAGNLVPLISQEGYRLAHPAFTVDAQHAMLGASARYARV